MIWHRYIKQLHGFGNKVFNKFDTIVTYGCTLAESKFVINLDFLS